VRLNISWTNNGQNQQQPRRQTKAEIVAQREQVRILGIALGNWREAEAHAVKLSRSCALRHGHDKHGDHAGSFALQAPSQWPSRCRHSREEHASKRPYLAAGHEVKSVGAVFGRRKLGRFVESSRILLLRLYTSMNQHDVSSAN